jgi:serine/threonine protein kinase
LSKSISPDTIIGHYRVVSQIGEGGMGEVYLAEDSRLHRKVALKILPSEMAANQERMRRFKQEATAAAALNHPPLGVPCLSSLEEQRSRTPFRSAMFDECLTLLRKFEK